jgi:tRNA-dihydrouridine synthase 1
MVRAAKMLENEVDAIDVNFGCPQGIARRGHYGSFLLEDPDLVERIVTALSQGVKVPIFCKIRRVKGEQQTLDLVQRIERAGCRLLTVHGRTKEQNKDRVGECDWAIIRRIKETLSIPVVANGGIYLMQDVNRCLAETHADGVMSA